MKSEPGLNEIIQPFIAYFWVIALTVLLGVAAAAGLSYAKPPMYQSQALLSIDSKYISPEAVASIVTTRAAGGTTVEAVVTVGGLVEIAAISQHKGSVESFLANAIEDTRVRAEAVLPDYTTQQREALAHLQDTITLFNGIETPLERAALSAQLPQLVGNYHALIQRANGQQEFFKVVTEATGAQPNGARIETGPIAVAALMALLAGCLAAWLLYYRKSALPKTKT